MLDVASWLATTKLHPPRPRPSVLERPRLRRLLCRLALAHRLTLVSAPAGYGKTTLLTTLPQELPGIPVAWLSLDDEDNDPARYVSALVGALRQIEPALGSDTLQLVSTPGTPGSDLRRVAGVLINEIVDRLPAPFVLVLDDLHVVTEPAIQSMLAAMLDHLPAQMHLVIATRHDPPLSLARLRARRELAEVRLADLRLTLDESDELLRRLLGFTFDTGELRFIHEHTEGWAAGMHLLASSLDRNGGAPERRSLIDRLAEPQRYVFEFLAEEVLATLDADLRAFLLRTSILAELTPPLCAALTDRSDAAAVLEGLYRRDLFVTLVDGPSRTYRYHDLFREFLRQRLERELADELVSLHERAALHESSPSRAVRHCLAAGLWTDAADRVEAVGESFVMQGSISTVRSWLDALPDDVIAGRPRLSWLLGVCAYLVWDLDLALSALQQARNGFKVLGDERGRGGALVFLATVHAGRGELDEVEPALLEAMPLPVALQHRIHLLAVLALRELSTDGWARSLERLDEMLDLIASTTDAASTRMVVRQLYKSPLVVIPGGVERAERFCRLAANQQPAPSGAVLASIDELLAWAGVWRGEPQAAIDAGRRAVATNLRAGDVDWAYADVGGMLPMCNWILGNTDAAERSLRLLQADLALPQAMRFVRANGALHLYTIMRIRWQQGMLDEARGLQRQIGALENSREWITAPVARALSRALRCWIDGRFADAERLYREAAAIQERLPFAYVAGDARLLLARLLLELDREEDALLPLAAALREQEERWLLGRLLWDGPFVFEPLLQRAIERGISPDIASAALACAGRQPAHPAIIDGTMSSLLSPRELDVLRLLADGASNAAIADQLFISINTVKRHVANVLGKLEATSRTEAAARARRLRLL